MSRTLSFDLAGTQFKARVQKVDRKKVYGRVDRMVVDAEGRPCYAGSLSADGMHLFGKGCFETGYLDGDGHWLERNRLRAVDETGLPLEKQPSSFRQLIQLNRIVTIDTYLQYTVKAVYQLEVPAEMTVQIGAADGFYSFPYNYTASYHPDQGFLIAGGAHVFLVVGEESGYRYIEPDQVDTPEEIGEEDNDELDFGMF